MCGVTCLPIPANLQLFLKKFRTLLKEYRDLPEETGTGEDINTFSLACYLYPNFYYEEQASVNEEGKKSE